MVYVANFACIQYYKNIELSANRSYFMVPRHNFKALSCGNYFSYWIKNVDRYFHSKCDYNKSVHYNISFFDKYIFLDCILTSEMINEEYKEFIPYEFRSHDSFISLGHIFILDFENSNDYTDFNLSNIPLFIPILFEINQKYKSDLDISYTEFIPCEKYINEYNLSEMPELVKREYESDISRLLLSQIKQILYESFKSNEVVFQDDKEVNSNVVVENTIESDEVSFQDDKEVNSNVVVENTIESDEVSFQDDKEVNSNVVVENTIESDEVSFQDDKEVNSNVVVENTIESDEVSFQDDKEMKNAHNFYSIVYSSTFSSDYNFLVAPEFLENLIKIRENIKLYINETFIEAEKFFGGQRYSIFKIGNYVIFGKSLYLNQFSGQPSLDDKNRETFLFMGFLCPLLDKLHIPSLLTIDKYTNKLLEFVTKNWESKIEEEDIFETHILKIEFDNSSYEDKSALICRCNETKYYNDSSDLNHLWESIQNNYLSGLTPSLCTGMPNTLLGKNSIFNNISITNEKESD